MNLGINMNNLLNFNQSASAFSPSREITRPQNTGFAPGASTNPAPSSPTAAARPQFDRVNFGNFDSPSAMPSTGANEGSKGSPESAKGAGASKNAENDGSCYTCENRRYQDGSDDSGVSFQNPTKVAPQAAASAVRSHEAEHVSREQSKAQREDRKVVSQTVQIHTSVCQECGKVYVSGGTTRTTTKGSAPSSNRPPQPDSGIGTQLNQVA